MTIKHQRRGALALAAGLAVGLTSALPTLAQQANFDSFTLSSATPTASVSGFTNGISALSSIAGRDRNGTICAGFADTAPDHIMVLQQDFATLTLQVNSGGNDTSLLIKGPDSTVRCGSDTDRRNPDALVQDQNWPTGTYSIWVGSHQQGQRYNYSLNAKP
ncbi:MULTISPECIES: hypothetical protein [Cyanophyceae]|uniref:hypothetical protein n=1 Tax=Cyanophyceae TaxID=3028117 RepID=UPI001685FC07|nr:MULTISPECIES: hypothetical protein [Cyanophyceae]MBD1918674.1 hypothetical protein [Phormidium sp. FACHB-77]MBD2029119.1 hypothetical protein [Phormidium sp. FACHB-322]MBD2051293.1 hypothetical protein [Leptolyngbya sp. FACHB-60]